MGQGGFGRSIPSLPLIFCDRTSRFSMQAYRTAPAAPMRAGWRCTGVRDYMTKRMLIDTTHAEETRVVVLDGNRLEDFDVEAATKKQLKGNIYLAKVVRVEPSLQAAFVEYGGGRHGFLAFGEIHPDYYQIPVADRQRLLKMQAEEARAEEEDDDDDQPPAVPQPAAPQPAAKPARARRGRGTPREVALEAPAAATAYGELNFGEVRFGDVGQNALETEGTAPAPIDFIAAEPPAEAADPSGDSSAEAIEPMPEADGDSQLDFVEVDETPPEEMGGDSDVFEGNGADEAAARRTSRFLRSYRIQEVIRRRQIMLIQVVKEERGSKGAALTTYISLAGRFSVLMPNSPRGGGISRKITSSADRRRLKEITAELEIPQGMGLIVRTAGANRPKPEIKRDCEYLMNQWDSIREITMASMAPALIYEEASLIKRAIRDGYSRDIDEVVVDGEAGWRAARDFMRMLMPSHAKKVQLWRPEGGPGGAGQPLFSKHGVEDQLDSMLVPTVQLKSGGYLVINQAEALVAIDVNSGRSTRERGIEETALRTNLEAAEEAARQLRLRDLAGLIVIDFIDMESKKNNAMVERRLKEALKNDRARIQIGQISHFGLLEMSRQRLRPSLTETSFITCPHCAGMGLVRNVESSAIHVLRQIEDEGAKARAGHIMVHAAGAVSMFILNNKRDRLAEIESRYAMRVHFSADETLAAQNVRIDRLRPPLSTEERATLLPLASTPMAPPAFDASEDDDAEEWPDVEMEAAPPAPIAIAITEPDADDDGAPPGEVASEADGSAEEAERGPRRRRRRRGGRREDGDEAKADSATPTPDDMAIAPDASVPDAGVTWSDPAPPQADETVPPAEPTPVDAEPIGEAVAAPADLAAQEQPSLDPEELDENGLPKARRRGRRGGRRRRRDEPQDGTQEAAQDGAVADTAEAEPREAPAPAPTPRPDPVRAEPVRAEPPAPRVPAYTGPTPADPFGGQPFDIFDILERAELAEQEQAMRRAAIAAAVQAVPVGLEIPPVPADATPPADIVAEPQAEEAPAPEPVAAAAVAAALMIVVESVAVPTPAVAESAAAPPTGPTVGPAIQPTVIDADSLPTTERKRGWWTR